MIKFTFFNSKYFSRITRKYADRVANAKDLILFRRDKRGLKLESLDFDDNEAAADLAECFQHEVFLYKV